MPYPADEFRAQHLHGCRLDPDHAGACLLARPFRIRPEGGREYVDEHEVDDDQPEQTMPGPDTRQRAEQFVRDCIGPEYVADFDVPAIADRLYDLAGSWDVGSVDTFDFWQTVKAHDVAAQEGSAPCDDDEGQDVADMDLSDTLDAHHGAATAADPPLLDSTDAAAAEVRWVASEARALLTDPDPQRRARFLTRKRALLHYIERTTT